MVGEYHERTGTHYREKKQAGGAYQFTQLLRGSVRFSRMHIANAIDGPITYGAEDTVLCNLDVFA